LEVSFVARLFVGVVHFTATRWW